MNRLELVLGTKTRSGQQWDIWEAVYSPQGPDGYPARIWDKRTGVIDRKVAEYWKEHYDLVLILRRDWNKGLGKKLEGKIHLYVGDMDNYYLNNAVYLAEDFLKSDEGSRRTAAKSTTAIAPSTAGTATRRAPTRLAPALSPDVHPQVRHASARHRAARRRRAVVALLTDCS